MRINNFICILLTLVLCGCQSSPVTEYQAPVYQSFLPTNWPTGEQTPEEHTEVDLFALSDAQKQHFLAYFHAPKMQSTNLIGVWLIFLKTNWVILITAAKPIQRNMQWPVIPGIVCR